MEIRKHNPSDTTRPILRSKAGKGVYGFVYVVEAVGTNRYKIGYTTKFEKRLAELQKQSPFPLRVLCTLETDNCLQLESNLHKKYSKFRVQGEWFELPSNIVNYFTLIGRLDQEANELFSEMTSEEQVEASRGIRSLLTKNRF